MSTQVMAAGSTVTRLSKLAHVVMRVSDLPRARDWYLKLLDAHTSYENEQVCFMTYDDEHHRIGLVTRPGLSSASDNHTGLEHIAFTYPSLQALLANFRRLKADDIVPYWPINHGPTVSLYYKDPDGNRIELQYDVFDTNEDVDAYFASGQHDENFMGIIFDPEQMIAQLEQGVDLAEITRRPKLPPGTSPWDMHRP